MGKVTLVGAGPYDLGLLTLKGIRAIKEADVIIYDRLLNTELLTLLKDGCEKIDAGKESNNHHIPQSEINKLLLEKALQNKNVVRLKGGDPYLFGRGAEELKLLAENNIPFEVIPGVTSAISVPAYAGIPVTHRDYSSSLHIITGHKRENKSLCIDYEALTRLGGTLVFMMSAENISIITKGLLKAGMDKDMPSAVIENGTSAKQRKLLAPLRDIEALIEENKILPPSVFIVGEVCRLSEQYDWFSKLPLKNTKILLTGHKFSAEKMARKLYVLGADVITYPCIKIVPIKNEAEIFFEYIDNQHKFEWLIFTSVQGVICFFESMRENKLDIRSLKGFKIAAVGPETEKQLMEAGIFADYVPEEYNGRALALGLAGQISGQAVIIRALDGAEGLTKVFKEKNILYKELPVYKTELVKNSKIPLQDIDYVVFKSAGAVHGFVRSNPEVKTIKGICIGEQTAKAAAEYGIRTFVSEKATIDSMVDLIKELRQNDNTSEKNEKK